MLQNKQLWHWARKLRALKIHVIKIQHLRVGIIALACNYPCNFFAQLGNCLQNCIVWKPLNNNQHSCFTICSNFCSFIQIQHGVSIFYHQVNSDPSNYYQTRTQMGRNVLEVLPLLLQPPFLVTEQCAPHHASTSRLSEWLCRALLSILPFTHLAAHQFTLTFD